LSPKKLRYGRFSTISCAAQPSSRARETFSRPDPGAATPRPSKSAARWCSYRDGLAAVTWTTEANLLVSDVHADRAEPALNQLYQWWSAHS
jgi:hypothetical protein